MLNQIHYKIYLKHYSICIKKTYLHWIKRLVLFYNNHPPVKSGGSGIAGVEYCFSCLASERYVAIGIQNQALAVLLFLYREGLEIHLPSRFGAYCVDTRYLSSIGRRLWR